MTDADAAFSVPRGRIALAATFLVTMLVVEFAGITLPVLGLPTQFDVQAAVVGTFIVLFGGAQITHGSRVAASSDEGTATQVQRGGALIVLGGLVVLAVAFL